jgi:hypothetical protein
MSEHLDAALRYASLDIPVFPLLHVRSGRCGCGDPGCQDQGKHPLTTHGVKDATTDPEVIKGWWGRDPEPNIAGAMGSKLVAIDEDSPGALLATAIAIPNAPAVRTGRGVHYFFTANGQSLPNRWKFAPGLDVRSAGGYVVLPPSEHVSGNRYRWIAGHGLEDVDPPELPAELAKLIVGSAKANGQASGNGRDLFGRTQIEDLLQEIEAKPQVRKDGGWREPMLRIVGSMLARRTPIDVILALCRRATWTKAGYAHEDTDEWVLRCVKDTRERWQTPDPADDEDTFDRLDDEQGQAAVSQAQIRLRLVPPSAMGWRGAQLNLIKDTIGFGMMALIYGESGSAKTLIAVSIAMHVALGRPWCGKTVAKGLVVYLAPEGGSSLHLRFHAWCRHYGIDPADDRLLFRTVPVRVDLCRSGADLEAIVVNIREAEATLGRCILLVVDTVSRALAGANENSPEDMGRFVVNCDQLREELGASILAVHHTPKGGDTPRGHSSLKNGADVRLRASKITDTLFELETEHVKDGPTGDKVYFSLSEAVVGKAEDGTEVKGGLVIHAVITAAGAPGRPQHLTERQLRVLQELGKEAAAGKWEHSTDEFNELCDRSGAIDPGSSDKAQGVARYRLKIQLANKRYIAISGDRIRLVRHDQGGGR